jgi:hypothetical protein
MKTAHKKLIQNSKTKIMNQIQKLRMLVYPKMYFIPKNRHFLSAGASGRIRTQHLRIMSHILPLCDTWTQSLEE